MKPENTQLHSYKKQNGQKTDRLTKATAVKTRIRSVERGICPIAAVWTVLFYCPDVKTNIRIATLTSWPWGYMSSLVTWSHYSLCSI